jgi:hypothetical protein
VSTRTPIFEASAYELPAPARGFRRLGSDFAPVRPLYLVYMPVVMLMGTIGCWAAPGDTSLILGAMVAAVVGLIMMVQLIFYDSPIRVSHVLAMTLALGYGLGSANTWFTVPRDKETLGEFLHKDPALLGHTMGSILLVLAILLIAGERYETPVFGREFRIPFDERTTTFITFGFLADIVAFGTGAISYMGAGANVNGELGIFPSFAAWLINVLFAVSVSATLNSKKRGERLYLGTLTVIQFFLQIPLGRRILIYTIILALITMRLGGYRFNWSWTKKIIIGGALGLLLYVSTVAFYYMRLAGFSRPGVSLSTRISLSIDLFQTKSFDEVSNAFTSNVQTRTFILGFVAELESLSGQFTPGYGRDLAMGFKKAIPSIIYPGKDRFAEEEGLDNELFNTTYLDEANSVLSGGATDFGLLGMIAYPLLFTVLLRAFFEYIQNLQPVFVTTFIFLSALGTLLEPELSLTDYFIVLRNGLLFGTVVWIFIILPKFAIRRVGE